MNRLATPKTVVVAFWLCAGALFPGLVAAREAEVVAISSTASSDYTRARNADGTYAPETFVFAKGGVWQDSTVDPSIDHIQFADVAQKLAGPLAGQHYISSKNPKNTQLMVMVYWGKTTVPPPIRLTAEAQFASNAAAALQTLAYEYTQRSQLDRQNASMLGYDQWWNATAEQNYGALRLRRDDLLNELEDQRYFVVLMAYDFQLLWKQKKAKLLWETRFSVRDRGHAFDTDLGAIAQNASKYFGQNTKVLIHREVPEGQIETGELQVIDHPASK